MVKYAHQTFPTAISMKGSNMLTENYHLKKIDNFDDDKVIKIPSNFVLFSQPHGTIRSDE